MITGRDLSICTVNVKGYDDNLIGKLVGNLDRNNVGNNVGNDVGNNVGNPVVIMLVM